MALLNGSRSLASVAGPTIGGLLVQILGAPLAMAADALSYIGSVTFLRRIRSPEPPIDPEPGSVREQVEYILELQYEQDKLASQATEPLTEVA